MNKIDKLLNKAFSLAQLGKHDASEKILLTLPENDLRVRYNLGWHALRRGDFRGGFEGLDTGRWIGAFGNGHLPQPMYHDQDITGKTLLLHGEGGIGDQIINARFVREFRARGAHVLYSCDGSLWELFGANGIHSVSDEAAQKKHVFYDYWAPAMSAPYMLGHDYSTLSGKPYLKATPVLPKGKTLRVGLRWGGNTENTIEALRRVNPALIRRLTEIQDIEWFSFQRDKDLVELPGVTDLRDKLPDWATTASYLASMDLLITSCTSVAHMAASMGLPTWIMTPLLSYYTWALPGAHSPWYDAVRLYRQTIPGDWTEVIDTMEADLIKMVCKKPLQLRVI